MTVMMVLSFFTILLSVSSIFVNPKYRTFRISLFCSVGVYGAVPVLHAIYIYDPDLVSKALALGDLFYGGVIILSAAALYTLRFPECYFPGSFDIWFSSHQIWHVLIFVAAFYHYLGVLNMHKFWHEYDPSCTKSYS